MIHKKKEQNEINLKNSAENKSIQSVGCWHKKMDEKQISISQNLMKLSKENDLKIQKTFLKEKRRELMKNLYDSENKLYHNQIRKRTEFKKFEH